MAKAGGKDTTWVRYSRAKKLISDYLEWDAACTDQQLLRLLETKEVRYQYGRFRSPLKYVGPRPDDPKFFKQDDPNQPSDGLIFMRYAVHIAGDTATRAGGAVAEDVMVALVDLVKLRLLPSQGVDAAVKKVGKKRPRRLTPTEIMARKEFPPNGRPPKEMTTAHALRRIEKRIQQHNGSVPDDSMRISASDDTMRRAIGRR